VFNRSEVIVLTNKENHKQSNKEIRQKQPRSAVLWPWKITRPF